MFRKRALLFKLAYLLRAIDAIQHRHLPVHQNNIQLLAWSLAPSPISGRFEIVESFEAMLGDEDLMFFRSKLFAQDPGVDLVVLDEEDVEFCVAFL